MDRQQILDRQQQTADVSRRELLEADKRTNPSAKVVHEAIRLEGTEELERPTSSVAWSGLGAGVVMGCSMLAEGILGARLPDSSSSVLISSFGYTAGFLIVTLGRQQLFTETTLTVTLPFLHGTHRWSQVLRFWSVVFVTNILGTILFALAATSPHLFDEEARRSFAELGSHTVSPGFTGVLFKGVVAGWLIALMVWLLPSARSAKFFVIVAVTYLIAIGEFSHVIAGSVDAAFAAMVGAIEWSQYVFDFLIPALIGNAIGGVILVALLNHAQVRKEL